MAFHITNKIEVTIDKASTYPNEAKATINLQSQYPSFAYPVQPCFSSHTVSQDAVVVCCHSFFAHDKPSNSFARLVLRL